MSEFFTLISPEEAFNKLISNLDFNIKTHEIATEDAYHRVLSEDIYSPINLPSFTKSTMDGYAVRATDTYGATTSLPTYLTLVDEISMGTKPSFHLSQSEAALIHTGGMLPKNADAVVMIENTQKTHSSEIEVYQSVSIGENILNIGEDVTKSSQIMPKGTLLRPQEIGALMALGITSVHVSNKPIVGIISTGDEVVHPSKTINPGQVRDINSYTLSALITSAGGIPKRYGIIEDDFDSLFSTAQKANTECDIVLIIAGSSVSHRDITSEIINQLGDPGVLLHGITIKPGKPTIVGIAQNKPILGLPGNPVSALVVATILLKPTISHLQGSKIANFTPTIAAILSQNIPSVAGREDHVPVLLTTNDNTVYARPIFGKSNLIFTLVNSTGKLIVPINSTGLIKDSQVDVHLY
ncbi:MAG TPA: molybdopterin molybdenumtransferase MoeA [Chloroflexi bacterium]|nr:molybdopterin molybdenumtransferase MoeA [Chloroflexota bacterium]|tara:strand:- start:831 stop:2063 length:1233 start_codon:yes stop_codon:yes gene_type:complete